MYYKCFGQSPYPFVGRGFTPAALLAYIFRYGGSKPPPYEIILIITQIGRENKFSAEICKHPYEKEPKASFFIYFSFTIRGLTKPLGSSEEISQPMTLSR